MRLYIYILFLSLISSANISAQFLLTEDFSDCQVGNPVENAIDKTNPDAGQWVSVDETSGSATAVVVDEQLTYANYIFSAKGKAMSVSPSTGIYNTVFCLSKTHLPYPCQPEGGFVDGSNEFYTAFIVDLSKTTASEVQEIFSYYQLNTGVRRGSIFYKLSADKNTVSFSFQKRAESPSTSWTKYYDKSKPLLLVVKYGHVCLNEKNLGHAEFELFINPNPQRTEEENSSLRIGAFENQKGYDTDLRYVNFRQSGQTTMKIAGVRVANSFAHVLLGSDDTSVADNTVDADFFFYTKERILHPNKDLNGTLSIYGVGSHLLRSYAISGNESIDTGLEPGIYILRYNEGNETKCTQKIHIY